MFKLASQISVDFEQSSMFNKGFICAVRKILSGREVYV
jgi:hypothetical protein